VIIENSLCIWRKFNRDRINIKFQDKEKSRLKFEGVIYISKTTWKPAQCRFSRTHLFQSSLSLLFLLTCSFLFTRKMRACCTNMGILVHVSKQIRYYSYRRPEFKAYTRLPRYSRLPNSQSKDTSQFYWMLSGINILWWYMVIW